MSPLISRIQSNTQLYQRLKKELSEENGILLEVEDTAARHGLLTEKLNNLESQVNTLSQQLKKEYSALHKARHFSVRSAAATLKGKKKALIAKEEAEYQLAFENEQKARRDLENVKSELNSAVDKENRLKQQSDHLKNIRQQLNNLLEEVFYEPESTETLENQLRAELQNYVEQHALATNDLQRFRDTDHNLAQALKNITKAKELIKSTLSFVSFDLFGTSLIENEQIIYIQRCQQNIWEAQRRLNVARQVLPEIPYPASLDVVTNNHVLSLIFDGGYVDVAWQAKAQQGFNLLGSAVPVITNASRWVRDYLRYTEGAIQRLTATKETTYNSLVNERMRIFDTIILASQGTGNGGGSTSSTLSPPVSNNNSNNIAVIQGISSPPPPVYEAPIITNTQPSQLPAITPVSPINTDKHLLDPSSNASTNSLSHHLRTASQSSSIIGSPPSHPPSQPSAPSIYPYNNTQNSPSFSSTSASSSHYSHNMNQNRTSVSSPPHPSFNNISNDNNNINNNSFHGQPFSPSSVSSSHYSYSMNQNRTSVSSPPHSPFNNINNNNDNNVNNNFQGQPSVPSSSPNYNLQNQPLTPSSTTFNNNNNGAYIQGQPYISHNANNPFSDTKHLVSDN
ncbi:unnamed protein product [Cunninghamella echinulata]